MSTIRFQALSEAANRKPVKFEESDRKSSLFGSNVFNDKAMKQLKVPFCMEQKLTEKLQIT